MTQLVDHTIIRNLQASTGDVFQEIIDSYFSDSDARISRMENDITHLSQPGFSESAHALKGSSKNIGALLLAELCDQLEQLSRDTVPDDLSTRIEMIRKVFMATKNEILAILKSG